MRNGSARSDDASVNGKGRGMGDQGGQGSFDSRATLKSKKILKGREGKLAAEPSAAVVALRDGLGADGILGIDPLTATPRIVARLDGFLTGPSAAAAPSIALDYVRANA